MSDPLFSFSIGALISLVLFGGEVGVIALFNKTNTNKATVAALGVFAIAFVGRMVLLLLSSGLGAWGVRDSLSFGLGIVGSYLLALSVAAVFWAKKKG